MTDVTPTISVIAVSYNHEPFVTETLDSIHNQTFQDFELIYCDDASSDRSVAIATDWLDENNAEAKRIIHSENQGFCRTLNEAISRCNGKYIQIIACDDILMPEKFSRQVALFERSAPNVAVVSSDAFLIDGNGSAFQPFTFSAYARLCFPPTDPLYTELLRYNRIAAPTALIRRAVYDAVGMYDEQLDYEDWDMWLRLARSHRFLFDDYITVRYRVHGANLHLDSSARRASNYWILRKHIEHPTARRQMDHLVMLMLEARALPDSVWHDYSGWTKAYGKHRFKKVLIGLGVPSRLISDIAGAAQYFSSTLNSLFKR